MDVSSIASLATGMSNVKNGQEVGIAVLKKALDAQKSTAAQLIAALPAPNLPPNLGRNINTTA